MKNILTFSVFVLLIGGLFLSNLLITPPDVIISERRRPAPRPELSVSTVLSSEFMRGSTAYAADNFVFREAFRTARAVLVFNVFMQSDKAGLYFDRRIGVSSFQRLDERSVERTAEKIAKMVDFFPELDIYFAVIPDKSFFAERYVPGFDINTAHAILSEQLDDYMTFIDLTDALSAEAFYKTDPHWNQAELRGVLDALSAGMDFSGRLDTDFSEHTAGTFHGVYAGQIALPLKPDTMYYLLGGALENAQVSYFNPVSNNWEPGVMYDAEAVNGRDPYDVFLRGVQPLIIIENPSANTNRELYLFRDSFGSSLAPLLTSVYSKITVIDMRYVDSRVLDSFITFAENDADVLFLYSSQILNSPDILQIN